MTAPLSPSSLAGAIDLHIHSDPDIMPRSMDGLEVASLAKKMDMRGIVLKNHFEPTASLAFLARKQNPEIEVFGGIALNLAVGGINPAAVERMVRVKGGYGRIVWMPTFDSENQVRRTGSGKPYVSVARGGSLLAEVIKVLSLVAENDLVLATGHSSPAEALLLIREARKLGIKTIIATHPIADPVFMNTLELKEAAGLGAYIEFTCLELAGPKMAVTAREHAAAIQAVGIEHCFLASDLGQAVNPPPPEGFAAFIANLAGEGLSEHDLEILTKQNPAKILSLD